MIIEPLGALISAPILSWMPKLTLVFLLAWQPWSVYAPAGHVAALMGQCVVVLVVGGIFIPGLSQLPAFWMLLTVLYGVWIVAAYHVADNHYYLMGYWCLAISVALFSQTNGEQILRQNARLLVGCCFACAVVAKLLSRHYRDGSFFTYLLMLDERFVALGTYLGGLTPEVRRRHKAASQRVRAGHATVESAPVGRPLRQLAAVLTWWTVAIEAAVAITFLLPFAALEWWRLGTLGVFALSTFALVSVPAFGQVLLILLVAATDLVEMRPLILLGAIALTPVAFGPQVLKRIGTRL